jgi:hypothetical protein
LHCPPTRFSVVISGDENDGDAEALGSEVALELQSIHARHLYVNNETRGILPFVRLQETLSRLEGSRSKAKRFDEQCCGPADGFIVVNYRN